MEVPSVPQRAWKLYAHFPQALPYVPLHLAVHPYPLYYSWSWTGKHREVFLSSVSGSSKLIETMEVVVETSNCSSGSEAQVTSIWGGGSLLGLNPYSGISRQVVSELCEMLDGVEKAHKQWNTSYYNLLFSLMILPGHLSLWTFIVPHYAL